MEMNTKAHKIENSTAYDWVNIPQNHALAEGFY